ncbi:MAG TPA: class I SAM-dependent methyltransferase [Dehalococcoidia bacterium]|nr:class I SAM-dependent methyltransferase [Dehalococcoidia bacterium]
MREYWDSVSDSLVSSMQYSKFGLHLAPFWRLERKLIIGLCIMHLIKKTEGDRFLLLKSDLWNEALDSKGGNIYDFLGAAIELVDVIGIDISPQICRRAKRNNCSQELDVACGDIRSLPFEQMTYDAILDLSTLDHIPASQTSLVIQEYYRVLKTRGILCLVFDTPTCRILRYLRKLFNYVRYGSRLSFNYWWPLPPDRVRHHLIESGFIILNEIPLGLFSLSPVFLKIAKSRFVDTAFYKYLYHLRGTRDPVRIPRQLLPLSTQYMIIVTK